MEVRISQWRLLGCFFSPVTAISFQTFDGEEWAPYYGESGDILSHDDWQEIVTRTNKFYEQTPPNWIEQENTRLQDFQAKQAQRFAGQPHPIEQEPTSGWIYILRAGDYYKIGRSQDPVNRYSQLATLPPWPTEIVHTFETENYHAIEKDLHDIFASKRANGEWFALDAEDVELLRSLQ